MSTVIHELIHVLLFPMFVGIVSEDLEEILVLALEADLYAYIKKSKERLARWNDLIARKLTEATDGGTQ